MEEINKKINELYNDQIKNPDSRKVFLDYIHSLTQDEIIEFLVHTRNEKIAYNIYINLDANIRNYKMLDILVEKYESKVFEGHIVSDKYSLLPNAFYLILLSTDPKIIDASIAERIINLLGEKIGGIYRYMPEETQTDELFLMANNDTYSMFPDGLNNELMQIYIDLWEDTKNQTPEKLDILLKNIDKYNLKGMRNKFLNEVFHSTRGNNEELFLKIFEKNFPDKTKEELEIILKKYNEIEQVIPNIHSMIDIELLDDKYAFLKAEQILYLSTGFSNNYFLETLKENIDNTIFKNMIIEIGKNEEYSNKNIDILVDNLFDWKDIINDKNIIKEAENNEDFLKKLLAILLTDSKNYFEINSVDDIYNYDEIKNKKCLQMLKGDLENKKVLGNQKKFALLELIYGIDYETAENYVNKYGTDIETLDFNDDEEKSKIKNFILGIKHIVECDDGVIDNLVSEYLKNGRLDFLTSIDSNKLLFNFGIEEKLIGIFTDLFQEKIDSSTKMRELKPIIKNGKKIENKIISPIDENGSFHYTEFSLFIRVEGAYSKWEPPKDYKKFYSQVTETHGNCESYINQSQIAAARSKTGAPTIAYFNANGLMLAAPWDIASSKANVRFSTTNTKWYYRCGIQFNTPEKLIDNTRHNHNETVFERIIGIDLEKKEVIKRTPGAALYIRDSFSSDLLVPENGTEAQWEEELKLAAQMGIPFIQVDKEGFAIQEEMLINEELKDLGGISSSKLSSVKTIEEMTGKKCETVDWSGRKKLPREELILDILNRFENNAVGLRFSKNYNKYFTEEKRQDVISSLMQIIDNEKEVDPKQYVEDLKTIEKFITQEKAKEYTSTNYRISYETPHSYMSLEREIDKRLVEAGERTDFIELKEKEIIFDNLKFIYNSGLYDYNKHHSVDHISKVLIFSNILANNEGLDSRETLLLSIAASLHDCSRRNLGDNNKSHARESAEDAKKILNNEDSPFKKYNLTNEEIRVIQMVIEYHETKESELGELEYDNSEDSVFPSGIKNLKEKYNIPEENMESVKRLCALLKDADALDRLRFSDFRSTLHVGFLHTQNAKDIRMLSFATLLNEQVAYGLIKKYYDRDYNDNLKNNSIKNLHGLRTKSSIGNTALTYDEMMLCLEELGIDFKKEAVMQDYSKAGITKTDIERAMDFIRKDIKKNYGIDFFEEIKN